MNFIPNSAIKNNMLKETGLKDIEELFLDIPKQIQIKKLNLQKGLSQQETEQKLREISNKNRPTNNMPSFLGGGIKPHYIPPAVKSIISRAEFYTAYTPYQPEASQGFLQAMFEYQSIIAEITGMDISNASLYDGATALGEASLMCSRINQKKTFVIPQNISWEKKSVLKNYTKGSGIRIKEISYDDETGKINLEELKQSVDNDTTGVYVENPNFFGVFEDGVEEISEIVKDPGSLFVVGVDPVSLGIVKSPGEYGADIVIGEGRSFGNTMDFGGSSLGIFACRNEFLRQMPGRIIGMTKDLDGRRAFCMTLQTREQHIRRGKATSNICTNEGLCALTAVVYLAWLGGNGLEELSRVNFERGQKLVKLISSIDGFEKRFMGIHFNEFVIKSKTDTNKVNKELLKKDVQGGLSLGRWYPELRDCMLFGVSEMHTDKDIEKLVSALEEVSHV
ncbi:MAG: aminomethyl-transferring glycine dehydrogenase subunit GcvPA [Candidatus Thermoplasmatota archaeon]|jgi:glycine dehydrogenase subunit 1|nr:aminomethyl-transferring glycine dehydrogenase subunit GcvPA [Candidatus Thermoplasmatota archaeon]